MADLGLRYSSQKQHLSEGHALGIEENSLCVISYFIGTATSWWVVSRRNERSRLWVIMSSHFKARKPSHALEWWSGK